MSDWHVTPHPVPPELDPSFVHADPPLDLPKRENVIAAELEPSAEAFLDEDVHPTGAWTVGERLDPEVAERLRQLIDEGRA